MALRVVLVFPSIGIEGKEWRKRRNSVQKEYGFWKEEYYVILIIKTSSFRVGSGFLTAFWVFFVAIMLHLCYGYVTAMLRLCYDKGSQLTVDGHRKGCIVKLY